MVLKHIRRIAEWGIHPDTPLEQAHHFRLTNVLLLFMFFASFLQTALCFLTGAYDAGLLNSTAPVVFGSGLLLMKEGRTTIARVFVVIISYTAGYAVVASMGPESYFQFIFLFASAFSLAFFSVHERGLLAFGLITPIFYFALLEITHYEPVLGMSRAQPGPNQIIAMRIVSMVIIWSLMVFHFFYFIRDRRKAQEQLVSSAKMVSMGRMAAGIAHEVNNPLQLIVSHAERMKNMATKAFAPASDASPDRLIAVADQIQSVAMRIGSINKGLLAISRDAASDPMHEVSVRTVLNLSLDLCRAHLESNRVELRVSEFPQTWTVIGRETQLSEVILNLLNNAYDAVLEAAVRRIEIEVKAEREWIEIAISDSGPGVSPKVVHRIFDPFFTTKPLGKGTGLGLSISHGIMAAHGGHIAYDPRASGARFLIRIPRGVDLSAPDAELL